MEKAIHYFLKADEKGVLGKDDVHYQTNYKENGGDIHLSETDMQRLKQQEEEIHATPYMEELHTNMGLWKKDPPNVVSHDSVFVDVSNEPHGNEREKGSGRMTQRNKHHQGLDA